MTTVTTPEWGVRHRKRRGLKRVIIHIVAAALLGALLLTMGLIGSSKLTRFTAGTAQPKRAEALYSAVENAAKAAALEVLPTDDKTNINNFNNKVLSSGRKTLKAYIADELAKADETVTVDETAVVGYVLDQILGKVDTALKEDAAPAVREAISAQRDNIITSAITAADEAVAGITRESVKNSMSRTGTEDYALMYFSDTLLIVGGVCLAFSALLLILWFTRDEAGRAQIGTKYLSPFDYLLPFLIGVGVFTFYPMIRVLIMSFQENYKIVANGGGEFSSWGLGNYSFVLTGPASDQFLRSLENTGLYVLFTVPISVCLSIVIAYLLNQKSKLNALFQTGFFLPMVTTATAVGLVWRWMFNQNYGLINALVGFFSQFFGAPQNINWLQTGGTNHTIGMTVLIIYGIWNSLPMTIILLLSGLQNIDDHLYTVAKVDGSGPMRIFFKITVPLLSPTIGLVMIINSISAFKVYTDVFVLWNGAPDAYQMETVAWYIYNNISGNDGLHYTGLAAAAAMVLFVIIFIFTMLQKFIQRKWVYQ